MKYIDALQDGRVQYAAATGRIDENCKQEVVEFLEDTMRKAAQGARPQNGYVHVKNMYAEFTREITDGKEASKSMDADRFFSMLDSGYLTEVARDDSRSAKYYIYKVCSREELEALHEETKKRLARHESFLKTLGPGRQRIHDAAEAQILRKRIKSQKAGLLRLRSLQGNITTR